MANTGVKKKYNVIDWRTRFWAKVTKTDTCWLWTAATNKQGYGVFRLHGRQEKAHRVAYELECGPVPAGLVLDHIDCVEHCVRPTHLRAVTQKQNTENKSGVATNNTSGHRGVHWNSQKGKWKVTVRHNGKLYYFGLYADLQEAAEVARVKRNELFTHNERDRDNSEH
jgi:HNH endonuclease